MRKPIQIKGISTTSAYEDGECLSIMNVRHEQGVLKPVENFPIDFELAYEYSHLYWHKNNDYQHLIGVRGGWVYWIKNAGTTTAIEEVQLLPVTDTVVLSHIGNILNVLDGTVLKYIFWKDTAYLVINTDFDGAQTDTKLLGKVDLKVDVNGDIRAYYGDYSADQDIRNETFLAQVVRSLFVEHSDGRLTGFFMARIAIELYDGNYISLSNPMLMGCAADANTRVDSDKIFPIYGKYTDVTSFSYLKYETPTIKLWDGSYTTAANECSDSEYASNVILRHAIPNYREIDTRPLKVFRSSNSLKYKVNSNIDESYESIVKSISVFITPQVEVYKQEDSNTNAKSYIIKEPLDSKTVDSNSANTTEPDWIFNFLEQKTNAEIIEELASLESFYKVHEIAFEDIKTTTENNGWVTIDLKGKLGDNLFTQERLKLDTSNIKAKSQMTYNSMLHAWDINNVIGRGYPLNYFYAIQGVGQFPSVREASMSGYVKWVEVKIKTDNGITSVVRGKYTTSLISHTKEDLSPMLSYPDSRAYEMTTYDMFITSGQNGYINKNTFKLTESKTGNFAYYISPDLKPIPNTGTTGSPTLGDLTIPSESNQELRYQNKLKVSNVNNPFLFPDAQTYQVGDGAILNVGSQSIRTSDGQFGQYPLICFCTDGLFSLEVGDGTVTYSKAVKPQSYERPISSVICTTPFGIAFISNRGLCMVAGQEVIYLSEPMFEKFRDINLELPTAIENSFDMDMGSFNDYLKRCTAMIYNPKEQELIIINPYKLSNYVYNFKSKQFYRNDELITNEINNSLPSLQVWNGTTVKNVTSSNSGSRSVSFVTRPIKIQTTDLKRFERVIVRAVLKEVSGSPATTCIWGSNDDINFKLLRGLTITNGTTRKDIDFGMFGKTTYRSYIVGLSMTLTTDSEIEVIEMEIEKLYNNTNMQ